MSGHTVSPGQSWLSHILEGTLIGLKSFNLMGQEFCETI